jgi:hypothetical protein
LELVGEIRQNAPAILQHISVPISNDSKASGPETRVALNIAVRPRMLTAIDFNHEFAFEAYKIENEGTKWNLAPKLDVAQSTITEQAPEHTFRVRHFPAQCAGVTT